MKPQRDLPEKDSGFSEKVIAIDRVARVVKGGRRFRFRALVVVGDQKGQVGVGLAKGADVTAAVAKATDVAKKKMYTIAVVDGTIPHEVYAKAAGAKILIKPAAAGTGLIAGGVVRTLLEAVGINNALSKSLGSSNKVNMAYATLEALRSAEPKDKWITARKAVKKAAPVTKTSKKEASVAKSEAK